MEVVVTNPVGVNQSCLERGGEDKGKRRSSDGASLHSTDANPPLGRKLCIGHTIPEEGAVIANWTGSPRAGMTTA